MLVLLITIWYINEYIILQHNSIMTEITSFNKLGSLTNLQINNYLRQYPEYLGTYSKDQIPYAALKKESKGWIGIIMNLASHTKTGTHWTLLMQDHAKTYYFDPFGAVPPLEVIRHFNHVQHTQKIVQGWSQSDCGYLCMYVFIRTIQLHTTDAFSEAVNELPNSPVETRAYLKTFFKEISVPAAPGKI